MLAFCRVLFAIRSAFFAGFVLAECHRIVPSDVCSQALRNAPSYRSLHWRQRPRTNYRISSQNPHDVRGQAQAYVFNEDDHYQFDQTPNNFVSAVNEHALWGYFDYRRNGENFNEGFQSVPADWTINSERKRQFFSLLSQITGESAASTQRLNAK